MAIFHDQTSGLSITNEFSSSLCYDLSVGTWTQVSSTEITVDFSASGHTGTLTLTGTGLNLSGADLSGTISGIDLTYAGSHDYTLTGLSLDAGVFKQDVDSYSYNDLNNAIYAGNDVFHLNHANASGDAYTLYGGDGNDTFYFGSHFNPSDNIDGGTGHDTIVIAGAYSGSVDMGYYADMNIEKVTFGAGHSYDFSFYTQSGQTLTIDGRALHSTDSLVATADYSSGDFIMLGGAGKDTLTGGENTDKLYGNGGNDTLYAGNGTEKMFGGAGSDHLHGGNYGADTMFGNGGNDQFYLYGYSADYTAVGGSGNDTFRLGTQSNDTYVLNGGPGTDTIVMPDTSYSYTWTMTNIERMTFSNIHANYSITMGTNDIANTGYFTVAGSNLQSDSSLTFDGSLEVPGHFAIYGGKGNDTLTGGHHSDTLFGGRGYDHLTGGGGADTFLYTHAAESTSTNYDTIEDFNANADKIDLWYHVKAIDHIVKGTLDSGYFDYDLKSAINSAHLGAHHAVLFHATTGDMSGDWFLIVDANGKVGYQPNQDLVILLNNATHLSHFDAGNFT